jgi:hypothetical protein
MMTINEGERGPLAAGHLRPASKSDCGLGAGRSASC